MSDKSKDGPGWASRAWSALTSRAARRAGAAAGAAIPVVLVNVVAFSGQLGFLRAHVHWPFYGQVLIALAMESLAVYLAAHAHAAQMANDSSTRLKLGSYLLGAVIGAMNYSHYAAPHWRPTVMAATMFLMSASSPWLWGIHSRRAARDKLMARGLVEEHAVRLGATRWTWHPLRSFEATWRATWSGETSRVRAIAMVDGRRAARRAAKAAHAAPASRAIHAPAPAAPAPAPGRELPFAPAGAPSAPAPAAPAEAIATAGLQAVPALGRRVQVPEAVVEEVRRVLAGLPVTELPSGRAVSALLHPTSDQRKLAGRLLAERRQADDRVNGRAVRPASLIATPAGQRPGGVAASG